MWIKLARHDPIRLQAAEAIDRFLDAGNTVLRSLLVDHLSVEPQHVPAQSFQIIVAAIILRDLVALQMPGISVCFDIQVALMAEKGKIELVEVPVSVGDETRVIVTFLESNDVDLRSRGIDEKRAADLQAQPPAVRHRAQSATPPPPALG